ncbi:hypothetical protein SAY86_018426 [Trapa natans]|uniref:Uncharacterized protein n=1 Tax=Trapa natans TaxID=22666 RepID=A0AAN7LJ15_TRANT|nr:hypothetical protein SAY86_018426 [Trapa natans]
MAVSFTRFSLLKWSPLEKDPTSNESSSTNLATELGFVLREPENLKIPFVKGKKISSSRKVKRKWQTPELRRNVDREFDIVLVPSDGDCFSGSDDSGDSDWSIGWLEPHGPEFLSDSENEDSSFAVLVPCYRPDSKELVEDSQKQFLSAIKNLPNVFGAGLWNLNLQILARMAGSPESSSSLLSTISNKVSILVHSQKQRSILDEYLLMTIE